VPFIYKIVNCINNKIYIGKSNINDSKYLGSGLKIVFAIKKYGKENFTKEIIEECEKSIVNYREKYWIKFYNSTDDNIGYNISSGGDGGNHYFSTLSEDEKQNHNRKISDSKKGKSRAPHSDETKKKIKDNQPTDPEWYKLRADQKRKWFTIIDHDNMLIEFTKNLKDFCHKKDLNYDNMLYNARTKKTLYINRWSCRKGIIEGTNEDILNQIVNEIKMAEEKIKLTTGRYDKHKEKNPMYNKNHTDESKQLMRESKKKTQ
jgi:group I intron endonuclease